MAKTVNDAFEKYMRDCVNLDADKTAAARESRDNLLDNIAEFDDAEDFFDLCADFNVHFGSFARKTQCRPLDDIDLMIGIAANGATYYSDDPWNNVRITASTANDAQKNCCDAYGYLNSQKVVAMFKNKLTNVREYSRSALKSAGEAVVLNLKSKEWAFDVVPCFHTVVEADGRDYYLIPNAKGNWQKTDPTIDRQVVADLNQRLGGKMLDLIRLTKCWNQNLGTAKIPSYLLETMIVVYCKELSELTNWIDINFRSALESLKAQVLSPVYDLKVIQGDINTIDYVRQYLFSQKAQQAITIAGVASEMETNGDHEGAIKNGRRYSERSFLIMNEDSIFDRQNRAENIALLYAQRREYSRAKKAHSLSLVFTAACTTLFTVLSACVQADVISALSTFMACVVMFSNKFGQRWVDSAKEYAARIQQTFDSKVYDLSIDYGTLDDIEYAEISAKYGRSDHKELTNWYSDYLRFPPVVQILCCQCENLRWDNKLRQKYRLLNVVVGVSIVALIVAFAIVFNSTVSRLFAILSWALPIIQLCYEQYASLTDDISVVKSIETAVKSALDVAKKGDLVGARERLYSIQLGIYEHRKNGTQIPDWYYSWKKNDFQNFEDNYAARFWEPK